MACEIPHKFELELYDTVLIDYKKLYRSQVFILWLIIHLG
jgi:hypothetical protein